MSKSTNAVADVDLHGYVLARLDAHLAELHTLRHELRRSRPARAGGRWAAATATSTAAKHYADDVLIALAGDTPADGPPDSGGVAPSTLAASTLAASTLAASGASLTATTGPATAG
jgi:hypothetical protein